MPAGSMEDRMIETHSTTALPRVGAARFYATCSRRRSFRPSVGARGTCTSTLGTRKPARMVASTHPDVFVSYAGDDRGLVLPVVDRLESHGVSVWLDRRRITGGAIWAQEIVRAIRQSKALILVFLVIPISTN